MAEAYQIHLRKDDISAATIVRAAPPSIGEGQALLRVDRTALTANNVTYAAMGEQFGYWRFFPAPEGFGIAPLWGYGDVVERRAPGVEVGARVWGYYPFATHLVVTPADVTARSFVDSAPNRAGLSVFYNRYEFAPGLGARAESLNALFRPLLMTAFLIDAHFAANDQFGAARVAFASASSKTALGAALLMRQRGVETVALTAARNTDLCRRTGAYDHVFTYDAMGGLARDKPIALIDMAGNADVINALADHAGPMFIHNCMVGATHIPDGPRETKGPPRTLFFAPSVAEARTQEWGAAGLAQRFDAAWGQILATLHWLDIREAHGPEAGIAEWRRQLAASVAPNEGLILRP